MCFFNNTHIKSDFLPVETTELTPNTPKDQSGSRNNINAEQLVENGHGDGKTYRTCVCVCVCVRRYHLSLGRLQYNFNSYSDCFPALLLWCLTLLFSLPVYFRRRVTLYCSVSPQLFWPGHRAGTNPPFTPRNLISQR